MGRDQHVVGREGVQGAARIEQFLVDLVVAGLVSVERYPEAARGEADHRDELSGRVGAEHGEARRAGRLVELDLVEQLRACLPGQERGVVVDHPQQPFAGFPTVAFAQHRAGPGEAVLRRRNFRGEGGGAHSSAGGDSITRDCGANTIDPGGTSRITTAFGPMRAARPIRTGPTTTQPAPSSTPSSSTGAS